MRGRDSTGGGGGGDREWRRIGAKELTDTLVFCELCAWFYISVRFSAVQVKDCLVSYRSRSGSHSFSVHVDAFFSKYKLTLRRIFSQGTEICLHGLYFVSSVPPLKRPGRGREGHAQD